MLVLRLAEQYGNCRDDPHERKLPIFRHSILPNRNPIRSRRQGGTNRALLHIPKNWLNGIITADPLRGFVNKTGRRFDAGLAHELDFPSLRATARTDTPTR